MSALIDFYFDFSSPYGFLGSEKIEALAAKHDRGGVDRFDQIDRWLATGGW